MVQLIEKLLAFEEVISQRRTFAYRLTDKERFHIVGLILFGFLFAPIAIWFLLPHCKKKLHHPRYGVLYWRVLMMPVLGSMLYLFVMLVVVLTFVVHQKQRAAERTNGLTSMVTLGQ